VDLCILLLQVSLTHWEEPGKLSEIVACNCLHGVHLRLVNILVLSGSEHFNEDVDASKVVVVVEVDELSLPELLGVHWGPGELLPSDLCLPLVERGELLVVLVKVLEESLENGINLLVDPRSVLQFHDKVECVDHGEVLEGERVVFQVIEHHADDAHNLLFVEVIEDFGDVLDDAELEVSEVLHGGIEGSQDPEAAAHVVGDLTVLNALVHEHSLVDHHALASNELFGELVGLEKEHEAVSERFSRHAVRGVLHVDQMAEEVVGALFAVLVLDGLDQHSECV